MKWRRGRRCVQKMLYINIKKSYKKSSINKRDLIAMFLKKEKRKKVNRATRERVFAFTTFISFRRLNIYIEHALVV
jgi:hypothetical protein